MATAYAYTIGTSQRPAAMALALVSAVVLSPLYASKNNNDTSYDLRWSSGLVLPMVLAGLIIAIKTTSSSSSSSTCSSSTSSSSGEGRGSFLPTADPSWVLRIGGSSWGLAGVLVMLMLVLSWQDYVQHFFWK